MSDITGDLTSITGDLTTPEKSSLGSSNPAANALVAGEDEDRVSVASTRSSERERLRVVQMNLEIQTAQLVHTEAQVAVAQCKAEAAAQKARIVQLNSEAQEMQTGGSLSGGSVRSAKSSRISHVSEALSEMMANDPNSANITIRMLQQNLAEQATVNSELTAKNLKVTAALAAQSYQAEMIAAEAASALSYAAERQQQSHAAVERDAQQELAYLQQYVQHEIRAQQAEAHAAINLAANELTSAGSIVSETRSEANKEVAAVKAVAAKQVDAMMHGFEAQAAYIAEIANKNSEWRLSQAHENAKSEVQRELAAAEEARAETRRAIAVANEMRRRLLQSEQTAQNARAETAQAIAQASGSSIHTSHAIASQAQQTASELATVAWKLQETELHASAERHSLQEAAEQQVQAMRLQLQNEFSEALAKETARISERDEKERLKFQKALLDQTRSKAPGALVKAPPTPPPTSPPVVQTAVSTTASGVASLIHGLSKAAAGITTPSTGLLMKGGSSTMLLSPQTSTATTAKSAAPAVSAPTVPSTPPKPLTPPKTKAPPAKLKGGGPPGGGGPPDDDPDGFPGGKFGYDPDPDPTDEDEDDDEDKGDGDDPDGDPGGDPSGGGANSTGNLFKQLLEKTKKTPTKVVLKPQPKPEMFRKWKLDARAAVCAASGIGKRAFKWISKVEDPSVTFEELEDCEGQEDLCAKLAEALNDKFTEGNLSKKIQTATELAALTTGLISGRQILWIIYRHYKTCEEMSLVFDVTDLNKVTLVGNDLSGFLQDWAYVLAGMRPENVPNERTLEAMFLEKVEHHGRLNNDIDHYHRQPKDSPDRSYRYLLERAQALVDRKLFKSNRDALNKKPGPPTKPPALPAGDGHGGGGDTQVCYSWRDTGKCDKGKACKWANTHNGKNRRTNSPGARKGKGKGKGKGDAAPGAERPKMTKNEASKLVCQHFKSAAGCRWGDACWMKHDEKAAPAPSDKKTKTKVKKKTKGKGKGKKKNTKKSDSAPATDDEYDEDEEYDEDAEEDAGVVVEEDSAGVAANSPRFR